MKQSLRIVLLLAASMPAAAYAADYDPPIFVEEAAEYVPVEVGSGWYLRGDVGYVFDTSIGDVDYTAFDSIAVGIQYPPPSRRHRSTPTSPGAAASATGSPTISAPMRLSTASAPTSTGRRQAPNPVPGPARRRHDLPVGEQFRSFGRQRHGQRLCRSRHLCRPHALCRRRRRLLLSELERPERHHLLRRRRS